MKKKKYIIKAQDGDSLTDYLASKQGNLFDPANDFKSAFDNNPATNLPTPQGTPNQYPTYLLDPTLLINSAAAGITGIANTVNSNKAFRAEQAKYYQSLRGNPVDNNYVQNDNPIYMATGGSIVDFLKGQGKDSSYAHRKMLAQSLGISNYSGTADQNIQLLHILSSSRNQNTPVKSQPVATPTQNSTPNYKDSIPDLQKIATDSFHPPFQSGIVVDKRQNVAHVVENGEIVHSFNVLTGKNPNKNESTESAADLEANPNLRATPTGMYKMSKASPHNPNDKNYQGNFSGLQPIDYPGIPTPQVDKNRVLGMHQTYDPANREKYYAQPASQRYQSYGCINCSKADYEKYVRGNFGQGDTVLVIDSKNNKDAMLLNSLKGNNTLAKYPYGGGPLTAEGAKEILRDGKVHGKKLTPAQRRYFGFIAGGGKPKAQDGLEYGPPPKLDSHKMADWNGFINYLKQQGKSGLPELDKNREIGVGLLNQYKKVNPNSQLTPDDFSSVQQAMKDYRQYAINQMQSGKGKGAGDFGKNYEGFMSKVDKTPIDGFLGQYTSTFLFPQEYLSTIENGQVTETTKKGFASQAMKDGGNWIPKKLHKGRCANPGSPECPKGSPQYNLAMTFKKHHGFNKAEYGVDLPETEGLPSDKGAWLEAEGGEVYQQPDGNIVKIDDSAPTHEQGGVPLNNVQRVLEDTSSKRNDDMSNALRITPKNFKTMFGFDSKKSVSHSEALELVDKYYQKKSNSYSKKINGSLGVLGKYPDDPYSSSSLALNMKTLSSLPNRNHIFDYLFDHQENVKADQMANNPQGKYAIGGDYNNPYSGGNTSQRTKYNLPLDLGRLNLLWKQAAGFDGTNMSNEDFQSKIYDWALQNDPDQIRNIWSSYKNTNKGKKLGIGKNYDFNNLSDEQLKTLKEAYVDGDLGARTLVPKQDVSTVPIDKSTSYPDTPTDLTGNPVLNVDGTPTPSVGDTSSDYTVSQSQQASNFNEPLRWYDLAGPLSTLASADRIPAKYNPVKFNEIRLKLQNPEPSLQRAQRQYNAATSLLPSDDTQSVAKLFAQKYAADNEVLGNYENINSQIKNQETEYNANVRDRQSQADQQSRGVFEQQMLQSKEAERQQKLSALDDIFNRIALNRKLNREGNLLQQLSPNFNQYGQYNGNQRYFVNNTEGGNQANSQPGVTFKTVYDDSGQEYKFAYDANGKLISKSKVLSGTKR